MESTNFGPFHNQMINMIRFKELLKSGERNFSGCIFTGQFRNCDTSRIINSEDELNLSHTNWSNVIEINYCAFDDCDFSNSNFSNIKIDGLSAMDTNFSCCSFDNTTIIDSDFNNSNFSESHMTKTTFDGCEVRYANFSKSHFENTLFLNADVRKVKFENVENLPEIVGSFNAPNYEYRNTREENNEEENTQEENTQEENTHEENTHEENPFLNYNRMRDLMIREGFPSEQVEMLITNMLNREIESSSNSVNHENMMISRAGLANFKVDIDNPETLFIKFLRPSFANKKATFDLLQKDFSFMNFVKDIQDLDLEDLENFQAYFDAINYKKVGRTIVKFCLAAITKEIEKKSIKDDQVHDQVHD